MKRDNATNSANWTVLKHAQCTWIFHKRSKWRQTLSKREKNRINLPGNFILWQPKGKIFRRTVPSSNLAADVEPLSMSSLFHGADLNKERVGNCVLLKQFNTQKFPERKNFHFTCVRSFCAWYGLEELVSGLGTQTHTTHRTIACKWNESFFAGIH